MLLFVGECLDDYGNALIADVVSAQVQLLYCFAQTQAVFKCFNALETYLILLHVENFQILFIFQGSAKSYGSFGEDTIIRETKFGNVLLILEHFADGSSSAWTNEVLRKEQLSQRGLLLDSFANSNAAIAHDLIVI